MKPPRRRRQRTWHWTGYVVDAAEQTMWVLMEPVSFNGQQVTAEFDRKLCPGLQSGDYFTLYSYMRGKKTRLVMRPVTVSAESVARAQEQATEWAANAREFWISPEAEAIVTEARQVQEYEAESPSLHHTLPSSLSSYGQKQ